MKSSIPKTDYVRLSPKFRAGILLEVSIIYDLHTQTVKNLQGPNLQSGCYRIYYDLGMLF